MLWADVTYTHLVRFNMGEQMIGLVTVYRINNYGSILQAFALKSFLESHGHEVFLVRVQDKPIYRGVT